MYTQRITLFPAAGKNAAVQQLLTDQAKKRQARGQRIGLAVSVVGDRPSFTVTIFHQDLAAFEKFRQANQADAEFAAYQAKLQPLLSDVPRMELFEVLVPPQQ
jgi:NIPSNAP